MQLSDTDYERSIPPAGEPAWRVLGLDLSLTATGISNGSWCTRIRPGQLRGQQRMQYLRLELSRTCQHADLIVVEGPPFGISSRGRKTDSQAMVHESAGWWWIATHTLWRMGKPLAVVNPSDLKLYIIGKGGGEGTKKEDVRVHVDRRFRQVMVRDNNEADALVLAAMGYDHLGYPLVKLPATHRRALAKVEWPSMKTAPGPD